MRRTLRLQACKKCLCLLVFFWLPSLLAAEKDLLIFEKSENPQNLLVASTLLTQDCRFQQGEAGPILNFHWMMDGVRAKPVHPMILSEIRKRIQVKKGESDRELTIHLQDFEQLKTSSPPKRVEVRAEKKGSECRTTNRVQDLELQKVQIESKKTWSPPFRKVMAIHLIGQQEGTLVKKSYR